MSGTKRSRAKTATPPIDFRRSDGSPLPKSADQIADARLVRYSRDLQEDKGDAWELSCDIRAVISKFYEAFADSSIDGDPNFFVTGELHAAYNAIWKALPKALSAEVRCTNTEAATFFFSLRIGDIVNWAVSFAIAWARIAALTRNEYVALSGEGFQAGGKSADYAKFKPEWRKELRAMASEFLDPFVRDLHGRPGRQNKIERDLAAQRYRNRMFAMLKPEHGKQRAMEIAKRETMKEFDLKTPKIYRNAMERKSGVASPKRRFKKT